MQTSKQNFGSFLALSTLLSVFLIIGCSPLPKKDTASKTTTSNTASNVKEAAAKEVKNTTEGATQCSAKADKRRISIQTKGSGCEVVYEKFDKQDVVASANNGKGHCEKVADRIINNLKEAGYSCE